MKTSLANIASSLSSPVERRLFSEYGAIFTTAAIPPPKIMFRDSAEVEEFQGSLAVARASFGAHEIELQSAALDALDAAAREMTRRGGSITARAADSGSRSYEDTVRLWRRNVTRGLEHWESEGRLSAEACRSITGMTTSDQVSAILDLEDREGLFFGTFFDRSILYSVAAPGASQHLSKLAFDVAEFTDVEVRDVLAIHGWYRTVPSDLPHFTYLGHRREALTRMGLVCIQRSSGDQVYDFWIPDPAQP
jgi:hypothetical protein